MRLGEEAGDAAADADEGMKAGGGQLLDLGVPAVQFFEEDQHGADAGGNDGLSGALGAGFADEALQLVEGGNDFALDALVDDGEEEGPDIGRGAEVVAAVADAGVDLDEVPVLELLETGADVGSGNGEGFGDFFSGEGFGREVEKGMDMGDGAIDAPVENELFHGAGQLHRSIISDISVLTEISECRE